MLASDALQRPMRRAAGAHVVFRMDFEEPSLRSILQNCREVLMLETRSGQSANRQSWKAETVIPAYVLFLHDGVHCRLRFRRGSLGLNRAQRTMLTARHFDARARSATDEFPGVALEVDGRRTLAGRARTGRAVILALEGDAVALLLVSRRGGCGLFFGERGGIRHRRHGGRDRGGQKGGTYDGLRGHAVSPKQVCGYALIEHV